MLIALSSVASAATNPSSSATLLDHGKIALSKALRFIRSTQRKLYRPSFPNVRSRERADKPQNQSQLWPRHVRTSRWGLSRKPTWASSSHRRTVRNTSMTPRPSAVRSESSCVTRAHRRSTPDTSPRGVRGLQRRVAAGASVRPRLYLVVRPAHAGWLGIDPNLNFHWRGLTADLDARDFRTGDCSQQPRCMAGLRERERTDRARDRQRGFTSLQSAQARQRCSPTLVIRFRA